MTPRRQNYLALPDEHLYALREIAEAKGLTMAGVIAETITAEIERGTVPDETVGVVARRLEGTSFYQLVIITFWDHALMELSPISHKTFLRVADILEAVASRRPLDRAILEALADGEKAAPAGKGYVLQVSGKHLSEPAELKVARVGGGVVLAQGEHRRVFAPSVALDVVRQIRKAAGEAPVEETAKAA